MSKYKSIKPDLNGTIINTFTFTPTRIQIRLINKLCNKILNSAHFKSYNNTYNSQKYSVKFIATKLFILFIIAQVGEQLVMDGKIYIPCFKNGLNGVLLIEFLKIYLKLIKLKEKEVI
jgi:hypothetical protein